jgi:hypothetical protein
MAKKKTKKPTHKRLDDDRTLDLLRRIGIRARAFRDDVAAELRRDGVKIRDSGSVDVELEPFNGVGTVRWRCWSFEFPEPS